MSQTLLVTGAAGQLGQRVIAHLLDTHKVPAARIIAGTRNPEKLSQLAAKGVQVRKVDFEDATVANALGGVDRMLLISTDAVDRPGRRLAQHKAAIEAARKAGVKHVLYTSMLKPDTSLVSFAPDHWGTEQALTASGLGWTILRNSWYAENVLMTAKTVLGSGKWFTSTGDGKVAHASREDCARAAAAALASESNANTRYDITGPQGYTSAQIAKFISEIWGKPVEVVQVTDEQLAEGMKAGGVPAPIVPMLVSFDANTRSGGLDVASKDVEKLTGKPAQELKAFLLANKGAVNA